MGCITKYIYFWEISVFLSSFCVYWACYEVVFNVKSICCHGAGWHCLSSCFLFIVLLETICSLLLALMSVSITVCFKKSFCWTLLQTLQWQRSVIIFNKLVMKKCLVLNATPHVRVTHHTQCCTLYWHHFTMFSV